MVGVKTIDTSGRGLRLASPVTVPVGSAVKIELEDSIVLGEICYSLPAESGAAFRLGVEIDQVLTGLRELSRINSRLMGSWPAYSPATAGTTVDDQVTAGGRE